MKKCVLRGGIEAVLYIVRAAVFCGEGGLGSGGTGRIPVSRQLQPSDFSKCVAPLRVSHELVETPP